MSVGEEGGRGGEKKKKRKRLRMGDERSGIENESNRLRSHGILSLAESHGI